jgi:hypothetical protein
LFTQRVEIALEGTVLVAHVLVLGFEARVVLLLALTERNGFLEGLAVARRELWA